LHTEICCEWLLLPTLFVVVDFCLLVVVAFNKKEYGCKWTWQTIYRYTKTQFKVKEKLVARKDMSVNEHDRLSIVTLRHKLK
jgi:hypothetical protein